MGPSFLKGSSATSAPATKALPDSGLPSARRASPSGSRPSPTVDGGYPLTGVSDLPDPDFHAYRQDLADVALADRVIASHYAEPLLRHLIAPALLYRSADEQSERLAELQAGDELWMLDDTRGWAWGYAGPDRRVGYVRDDAVERP
jgi:hypothetical protein